MQISLSYKSVLCSTGMRIQDSHYVILHESESVTEVGPPGPFIWQDVLNANDQDIWMIFNIICIVR